MATATLPIATTWVIDPAHTTVGFTVQHLMAAKVRGSFKTLSGSIDIAATPEASRVEVTIDAASIDTGAAIVLCLITSMAVAEAETGSLFQNKTGC